VEPFELQWLAVWIFGVTGIENDGSADFCIHVDWLRSGASVHIKRGRVVGVREVGRRPCHPGGEIILERFTPAPDGCLVRDVFLAIGAGD